MSPTCTCAAGRKAANSVVGCPTFRSMNDERRETACVRLRLRARGGSEPGAGWMWARARGARRACGRWRAGRPGLEPGHRLVQALGDHAAGERLHGLALPRSERGQVGAEAFEPGADDVVPRSCKCADSGPSRSAFGAPRRRRPRARARCRPRSPLGRGPSRAQSERTSFWPDSSNAYWGADRVVMRMTGTSYRAPLRRWSARRMARATSVKTGLASLAVGKTDGATT